jgi:Tfp pilus assembly protein PilO
VTARFASLSTRAQVALVSGALVLVLVIGYFALISPKKSTAAALKHKTAQVQQQIESNRSTGFTEALPAVRSASVFSLAKAMPNQLETPNVILQLNQLALESGISFDSISPGGGADASAVATTPTITTDPFAAEPITVQFTGSYYNLLAFLQRLRNLVRIENGHLDATGRLFDVSNIEFGQPDSPKTFPVVKATLTINTFVPQEVQPTVPGSTDTSATGTTTTGTTTTTSNPTSASPATSGGTS